VTELAFRDGVMERILLREKRYHEQGYLFLLAGLEYAQTQLPDRRHISGRELAQACRDLARTRFGVMARLVLGHWGIRASEDLGDIVFTLVELGFLVTAPGDTREDFANVFDFEDAFERSYPWSVAL
jgi:uncharacterized repeat protein (TIGR04138 family)